MVTDIRKGNFKRIIIVSPAVTYGVNIDVEYDYIFGFYENNSIDAHE
jgi:hypothetical protein